MPRLLFSWNKHTLAVDLFFWGGGHGGLHGLLKEQPLNSIGAHANNVLIDIILPAEKAHIPLSMRVPPLRRALGIIPTANKTGGGGLPKRYG